MPRLSKIRLTGCKYEGFKKQHENSIFDLTKDEDADHTLFTLYNGGGKGVMMQLIFQILLPGTKWGKNDGNKVISMFYDQRNNLNPYTFHVALEWILDTVPEKRLITGISMKATRKNTGDEEEEKTGLSFFLYTYEHNNNSYFNMENLPLYDEKTGEGIDLDQFEKFIDDNKRDFVKYSQSSVRRSDGEYYRYLETKGINRSEWLTLKTINKSEGGVGDYFSKASDNKAIFDNVIIPAISENIRNYASDDGDNLINMFKSNLSITKDLPVLIKREGYYKELLVEIKPIIQNSDSGSRFMDQKNRIIDEGNDIYHILKNQENIVDEEIEKWESENERAKFEKKELSYKKDNLYYNKEKMELEDKLRESKELAKVVEEKTNEIEDKQEELLLYEINEYLYEKNKTEDKLKNMIKEKERLVESLDIVDIKEKIDELDDEIDLEWDRTKSIWSNTQNEYQGYINYTNQIIEENKSRRKIYETKKDELQNKINIFQLKKDNLAKTKEALAEKYDFMSLAFPERIISDLNLERENLEKSLEDLLIDYNSYKEKTLKLAESINILEYELKDKEEKSKFLKEKIMEEEKYELELGRRISSQLLEPYAGELLDYTWFANKLRGLEILSEKKRDNLEEVQRAIWEKNIDKSLNRDDYFIPNKDIALIKEEIEKIDIHVETGTEYLKNLDKDKKDELLEYYPGFIYSLVIGNQKEWELIKNNIREDIFLNNMVPIYIRSEMDRKNENGFRIIEGSSSLLIEADNYLSWKDNLEREFQKLSQTGSSIRDDIKNIDDLKGEIKSIQKGETAYILNEKFRELERNILDITEGIRVNKEEKLSIDRNIIVAESKISENEKLKEDILNSIKELESYIIEIEVVEREEKNILDIRKDLDDIINRISNIEEDNEGILDKQYASRTNYNRWKVGVDALLTDIKLVIHHASLGFKEDTNYRNANIPNFSISDDAIKALLRERKALEEDIRSKNSSIAVLDSKIEGLNENISKSISDLKRKASNWEEYEYLGLSLDEIFMIIDEIAKNIKRLKRERTSAKTSFDNISGHIANMQKSIDDMQNRILKDHNRAATIFDITNINSDLDIVERDIISNEKYLVLCKENLKEYQDRRSKLQLNLTIIKHGYELDFTKGKMDSLLRSKIEDNSDLIVETWISKFNKNKFEIDKTIEEGEKFRERFIKAIGFNLEEDILKDKIIGAVKEAKIENFKNNRISFESMESHFEKELLSLSKDKEKAETAMKQWTERASIHVIRMVEALKTMVSNMNYSNEQGYIFPLVKLRGDEKLPKEETDVSYLLREYFIQAIAKVLELDETLDNIDDKTFNNLMGDKTIFSKALQGRYPTLMVYKMTEKNEFKYAKPRDEYYTTWEAINKGEGDLPEGSGGQTLSVNTFVIMMIMNFKKKNIGNENPWTVLILDNPFGKASARHVLDPIFEIANKLNFQLICFAAPEIIKVEISERFPVFWELKVEDGKVVHGGRVIK